MPIIRAAAPADLPALRDLIERTYRGDSARGGWTHEADLVSGPRLAPGELATALSDEAVRFLVAVEENAVVGCVQVRRVTEGRAHLGLLTVDPGRQANGLGGRLLAAGEDAGRVMGAGVMEMTVIDSRHELIAWYERRGWVSTGERRPFPVAFDPALEFVVLERALG